MGQRVLLVAFLLVLGVFGGLVARKYLVRTPEPPVRVEPGTEASPAVLRDVLLYFASADGDRLAAENRELEGCQDDEACLRSVLQALIDGPVGDLLPVLPARVQLRSIKVEEDLATLDLSREFIAAHPGGSHSELLTVYAVVDTLTVNFPYVRQVRFLVEGEPVATIKGHVDLRAPVAADFSYARPDERLPELPQGLFEDDASGGEK